MILRATVNEILKQRRSSDAPAARRTPTASP
jgi:hypothetical protein